MYVYTYIYIHIYIEVCACMCNVCHLSYVFPQPRSRLTGSSAQNSSGVHWCRHQVRFNQVLEKVPENVWGFGAKPGQVQQGSEEGSGEGLGGFGA